MDRYTKSFQEFWTWRFPNLTTRPIASEERMKIWFESDFRSQQGWYLHYLQEQKTIDILYCRENSVYRYEMVHVGVIIKSATTVLNNWDDPKEKLKEIIEKAMNF